jgi:multiple sugar transport system permease protein
MAGEFHQPPPWRRGLLRVLTYAILGVWSLICIFPLYWVAITSFKPVNAIDRLATYLPFVDFHPSLYAWQFILFDYNQNLVSRFINSATIGLAATLMALLASGMAIYGLTRFPAILRWPSLLLFCLAMTGATGAAVAPREGSEFWLVPATLVLLALSYGLRHRGPVMGRFGALAILFATRILPPVVIVLPLYLMAWTTGLYDTRTAMVLTYTAINLPVAAWLLQPILGPRAREQEEAAQLDGASHISIFFTILLPMVRVELVAAGLLVFLMCWNEYLFAAYLTADTALTVPPWMVGQISVREAQTGGGTEEIAHLSAATFLMALPALVFAAATHRFLGRAFATRA